jgi:cytochrome c oxidase assembly protein subunit 15
MLEPTIIRDRGAVLVWLMICIQLVATMVLVGGYTRLSGSGLSITKWAPVHGVIPPYNQEQWEEEFTAYKATPQYKLIHNDMSLEGFKTIFWPEYIHRLLGRIVGMVFFIPLLIFTLRSSISKRFFWRMAGIFALGGLQGTIGWIMVKSGLENSPYVSHTKLALHLSLAFTIFALILWVILDIYYYNSNQPPNSRKPRPPAGKNRAFNYYRMWVCLFFLQIIFGGFMAGLHAGLIYNTWPTMNGEFVPDGMFSNSSAETMLQNITFIQFIHRMLAVFLAISFLIWCYVNKGYIKNKCLGNGCILMASVIFAQFVLGVLTLVYHVPLILALIHQVNALFLWAIAIWMLHRLSGYGSNLGYLKLVR